MTLWRNWRRCGRGYAGWVPSWDDDEPFVLDDDFVAGATVKELGWKEREQAAEDQRKSALGVAKAGRRVDRSNRIRRATGGAAVPILALAGFVLLTVFVVLGPYGRSSPDGSGSSGTAGGDKPSDKSGTTFQLTKPNAKFGECLMWDQAAEAGNLRRTGVVPCDQPHLMQVSEPIDLRTKYEQYPTDREFGAVSDDDCQANNERLLGGALDPNGSVFATSIFPTQEGWAAGDRILWCGLARRSKFATGRLVDRLPPFNNPLTANTQQFDYAEGDCLGVGNLVDSCDELFTVQISGSFRIDGAEGVPQVFDRDAWAALAGSRCEEQGRRFLGIAPGVGLGRWELGGGFVASGWRPIGPESWQAGARVVWCTVGEVRESGPAWVDRTGSFAGVLAPDAEGIPT